MNQLDNPEKKESYKELILEINKQNIRTKEKMRHNNQRRRKKAAFISVVAFVFVVVATIGISGLLLPERNTTVVDPSASAGNNVNSSTANSTTGEPDSEPPANQQQPVLPPARTIDPAQPMVALTFDDGPYAEVTESILNTLEQYDGLATFFVVGSRISWQEETVKKIVAMGCEIGNHSFSHKHPFDSAPTDVIKKELNKTDAALEELTGITTSILRVPFGDVNDKVSETVNCPIISWDVDTRDWDTRNAAATVKEIKKSIHDGCIILMHDLYPQTAKACETIIPWLSEQGYQMVTIDEMMAARDVEMQNGEIYYNAPSAEEWQAEINPQAAADSNTAESESDSDSETAPAPKADSDKN